MFRRPIMTARFGSGKGWRARAIHDALDEAELTGRTYASLKGVGRRLGERDGTGPDDHPFLRSFRDESRAEGKAKTVREPLRLRGVAVSEGFPMNAPGFAEAPEEVSAAAALACDSEEDFRARIRGS